MNHVALSLRLQLLKALTGRVSPIILLVPLALSRSAGAQIQRQDFLIPGVRGRLHVREVRDHHHDKPKNLILLHGGGPEVVPSFDPPVPGYSLAEDFAKRGFRVFVMVCAGGAVRRSPERWISHRRTAHRSYRRNSWSRRTPPFVAVCREVRSRNRPTFRTRRNSRNQH